jgi:hypothetical protein
MCPAGYIGKYVYFDMASPAYGVQLVDRDIEYPELVTVVGDGDAVLMPDRFQPNISVPGPPHLVPVGHGSPSGNERTAVWSGEYAAWI